MSTKLLRSKLDKGAEVVMRDVNYHFNKRGHGWPLGFSMLVDDVFYNAFGFHLETILIPKLLKKYSLQAIKGKSLMVVKKSKKPDGVIVFDKLAKVLIKKAKKKRGKK